MTAWVFHQQQLDAALEAFCSRMSQPPEPLDAAEAAAVGEIIRSFLDSPEAREQKMLLEELPS